MPNRSTEKRLRHDNADLNRHDALLEDKLREKARTVKALRDSEHRYRRLFESAMDGILILDAETSKVVDVNPFLLALLVYSYDAVFGKHLWELGVFKDIAASKEVSTRCRRTNTSAMKICRCLPSPGSTSPLSLSAMSTSWPAKG